MATQCHERISSQVQRSLGKCVWNKDHVLKAGANKCKSKCMLSPNITFFFLCYSRRTTAFSLFTIQLPVFVAALVFHNTVLIVLGHFAGGTLHPGLVFSQCDHNRRSGGQFGGSPIRKPQRKEQSAFKQRGVGTRLKLLLMEKVCKMSNFQVWESNESCKLVQNS